MAEKEEKQFLQGYLNQINHFAQDLHELIRDPGVKDSANYLRELAETIDRVSHLSLEAFAINNEEIKDTASLIQNIFTKPVHLNHSKEQVSMLDAAKEFQQKPEVPCHLSEIATQLCSLPETTAILEKEIRLLGNDIAAILAA